MTLEYLPLLEIKKLKKYFHNKGRLFSKKQLIKAVDDVSFSIDKGQTMGIIGESGCGKSTVARTILRLYPPTDGEIWFDGQRVSDLNKKGLINFRKNAQMIFQDPYGSLNPKMTAGDIIGEALKIHQLGNGLSKKEQVNEMLVKVGLKPYNALQYPHEFSGGQRQRIGIARALAVRPQLVICDEPLSALDVSVQAQIVNMLIKLQENMNLTYLFIAHDLLMVKYISDKIGVMVHGKIVEMADCEELYHHPVHPYTKALISSILVTDPRMGISQKNIKSEGIFSLEEIDYGCRFKTRCPYAASLCMEQEPELKEISANHFVACHKI